MASHRSYSHGTECQLLFVPYNPCQTQFSVVFEMLGEVVRAEQNMVLARQRDHADTAPHWSPGLPWPQLTWPWCQPPQTLSLHTLKSRELNKHRCAQTHRKNCDHRQTTSHNIHSTHIHPSYIPYTPTWWNDPKIWLFILFPYTPSPLSDWSACHLPHTPISCSLIGQLWIRMSPCTTMVKFKVKSKALLGMQWCRKKWNGKE